MRHDAAVDVHHVVDGPAGAPPVVLLNSLGATLDMWDRQVASLSAESRVIRFDMRGHGASPVPPAPYSIGDLGGDVLALLDRLEIERASLCGVSLGGMVAMWLAIHAPERVDRLVLCCTSASMEPRSAMAERAAVVRAEGTEAIADAVVSRWFTPDYAAEHPDVVRPIRDAVAATSDEGYAGCCAAIEHMDIEDDLDRIAAPTFVIAGADDPSTPLAHAARIAARIPGARMAVVADAAHLANVQQADEVTALIARHLRDDRT
jgi:3-oxoadipate enol-lactonase